MFDLKEKAKRSAWEKQHEKGLTPKKSQEEYVKLVNELIKKYGKA